MSITSIDTAKAEHRKLHFDNPDQLLAEADRIAAADKAGKLRRTGNWTAGQAFGHLSTWINFPYDGYPPTLRPPWFIKLILKMKKRRFLEGTMPRGKRIPGLEHGTLGIEPRSTDEGLSRLRASVERLKKAPPPIPNIIFGPIPHDEWITMHLRHAEMHLGFLHP